MARSTTGIFCRLGVREMLRNWAQSIAIIAIGAIAVTLFVGLNASSQSLQSQLDELVALSNPADEYVITKSYDEADEELIRNAVPGEPAIESRFYSYGTLLSHPSMLSVYPALPRISKPWDIVASSEMQTEDRFFIIDHTLYEKDAMDLSNEKMSIGQEVDFRFDVSSLPLEDSILTFLDNYLLPEKENPFRKGKLDLSFTVTGAMKHPENASRAATVPNLCLCSDVLFQEAVRTSLRDTFSEFAVGLIYRLGFHDIMHWGDGSVDSTIDFPAPNSYLVRLPGREGIDQAKAAIKKAFEQKHDNNLLRVQSLHETHFMSAVESDIDQAKKLTMVFPVVFFIVAVLIILTSVRQIILKKRTEIGTYKALGVSDAGIHCHFFFQTGLLVIIGAIIGEAVGPILLPYIMTQKYKILYDLPARTYQFPVLAGLLTALAFLLAGTALTFWVTRKEVALPPALSMRPKAIKVLSLFKSKKEKQPKAVSLSGRMAGRNIFGDPVKSGMVMIGVLGCTMLLVCGFGIENTLDYGIQTDPYIYSGADVTVFLSGQKDVDDFGLDLKELVFEDQKLVTNYQMFSRDATDIDAENSTYNTYLCLIGGSNPLSTESYPSHFPYQFPNDQVMVSSKIADRLHIGKGDTVSFAVGSQFIQAKVYDTFSAFFDNGVFFHGNSPLLNEPVTHYSSAWVDVRKGVDLNQAKEKLLELSYLVSGNTQADWTKQVYDIVGSIQTMTNAVKVFAMLLAAVVLYDLGLMNFRERIREIATLKVLGFRSPEIAFSLFTESLSTSLVGIAGGLALGYPFMKLVLMINEVELVDFQYHIEWPTYLFGFLFTFLIAFLVNLALSARIKRVASVESLKSVE